MTAESESWRLELERAHAHLQRAIAILERAVDDADDLWAPASALTAALGRIYDAVDGRGEPVASVVVAQKALGAVAEAIEAAIVEPGALNEAAQATRQAAQAIDTVAAAFARTRPERAPPQRAGRVMASRDAPRLHRVVRPSLVPRIRIAPRPAAPPGIELAPLPAPASFEELEAAGSRMAARVRSHLDAMLAPGDQDDARDEPTAPRGDDAFIAKWARELLEEIAMLGLHRRPLLGDDWREMRFLEQRLLNAADAFCSLGSAGVERIEAFVLEAPVRDPTRLFAATFVASCLDGRDALGIAERLTRDAAPNSDLVAPVAAALKLAPHPLLLPVLRTLLEDSDPVLRALGAEVLAHRDLASNGAVFDDAELVALSEDRPEIAAHVLLPMAVRAHPATEDILARACLHTSMRLREAAWTALTATAPVRASTSLRAALDDSERAELLLALAGGANDGDLVLDRARRDTTPWRIDAVGWAGRVRAVPTLLDWLTHDDLELQLAAGRALDRLTGAALVDQVDVPPEDTVPRELPEPPIAELAVPARRQAPPLSREVSSPRDAPSEGSADRIEAPSVDIERWSAWWKEHQRRFDDKRRYRRGKPHALGTCLEELDGATATPAERQLLQLELAGGSRRYVHFDVDDFVARQEESIALWRSVVPSS